MAGVPSGQDGSQMGEGRQLWGQWQSGTEGEVLMPTEPSQFPGAPFPTSVQPPHQ